MNSNKNKLSLAKRREKLIVIMHRISIFFIIALTIAGIYLTINYDATYAWYNHPSFYFAGAIIELAILIWNPLSKFNFIKKES